MAVKAMQLIQIGTAMGSEAVSYTHLYRKYDRTDNSGTDQ